MKIGDAETWTCVVLIANFNPDVPGVSIIMATYNRSALLRYAILSVLHSNVSDWELIVVGDACTDDTEMVVAGFGDRRIRFYNLPKNCGEQSGPNNEGARQARGKFLAFLNHDDLWYPDHLEVSLEALELDETDLVFTAGLVVAADDSTSLSGVSRNGRFEPHQFVRASSWVFRRELVEQVGSWRHYRDCLLAPSQDWLFRAWRMRAHMVHVPRLTWVALPSGYRRGSYVTDDHGEHARWYEIVAGGDAFRDIEYSRLLPAELERLDAHPLRHPWRAARRNANRALWQVGLSSQMLRMWRHGGRGGYIDQLRKIRGLPKHGE